MSNPAKSSAERVRARRAKQRAGGLRPIQIWVPDTTAPGFAEEAARQSRLVAQHSEPELDAWLDENNRLLAKE
ncbi:MAG: antitoxin MazE family protein [Acetobacteraceae bacterium]